MAFAREDGMLTAWRIARPFALGVTVSAALLMGCSVDATSSDPGGGYSYGGGSASSSGSSGGTAGQPMLVDVDPNRTMNATPGDGVGVFTQYQSGGHWNVWWTCDTNKTSLPCNFDVTVTVSGGSITNAVGTALERTDTLTQATPQTLEVTTTTTTAVDGVTFDTVLPAGTTTPVITLDAKLNGVEDPTYLFFVQDGNINGNYTGQLTDPLMLEPSSP
jgi:hypothetical protein